MWEENEETAITVGLDLDKYWEMTPKQFEKYVKVYIEKERNRAKEMDMNNFNLGKYIAFAFNNPKKYPRRPFLEEQEKEKVAMTGKEMEEVMKRNTLTLGGTIR